MATEICGTQELCLTERGVLPLWGSLPSAWGSTPTGVAWKQGRSASKSQATPRVMGYLSILLPNGPALEYDAYIDSCLLFFLVS